MTFLSYNIGNIRAYSTLEYMYMFIHIHVKRVFLSVELFYLQMGSPPASLRPLKWFVRYVVEN